MRIALIILVLYLVLEPKKPAPRGNVFIEGGPSNVNEWEQWNPEWDPKGNL